ncbi:MAG: hypothetical protein V1740_03795 [Candidatus Woesearchaeota archaeon]
MGAATDVKPRERVKYSYTAYGDCLNCCDPMLTVEATQPLNMDDIEASFLEFITDYFSNEMGRKPEFETDFDPFTGTVVQVSGADLFTIHYGGNGYVNRFGLESHLSGLGGFGFNKLRAKHVLQKYVSHLNQEER